MSTSTELVPLAHVREALMNGADVPLIDPDVVSEMIGRRLMEVEDLAEVMDPEGRNATEKQLDTPFWLRSAAFMPSDIEDSKVPVYALLDAVDQDGTPRMFSCSGRGVVIQVYRLLDAGALPRYVKLIEVGRQKGARQRPLYLQDVPEPAREPEATE